MWSVVEATTGFTAITSRNKLTCQYESAPCGSRPIQLWIADQYGCDRGVCTTTGEWSSSATHQPLPHPWVKGTIPTVRWWTLWATEQTMAHTCTEGGSYQVTRYDNSSKKYNRTYYMDTTRGKRRKNYKYWMLQTLRKEEEQIAILVEQWHFNIVSIYRRQERRSPEKNYP